MHSTCLFRVGGGGERGGEVGKNGGYHSPKGPQVLRKDKRNAGVRTP